MFGNYRHHFFFASLLYVVPALSQNSALPAAPAARIVLPRALPTSWSLPHRVTVGEAAAQQPVQQRNNNIIERQAVQQIPFQWCPEFFANPVKLCSQCGGDSQVKGTCDDILVSGPQVHCGPISLDGCLGYYCKCSDSGQPDNNPNVTSTSVVDGQTATAVWAPITLTEYKSLRASTTVTLSETVTASSDSEVETVVAVVFAAGVAWWLAVQSGPIGAALSLEPPSSRPEGSEEDDEQCQSPKQKCKDCGGADGVGLCKTGTTAGCPCDEEEQNCDAANPPKCSVCGGGDTQSNCLGEGDKKGCKCCPDDLLECSALGCQGDNSAKCQAAEFKACPCRRLVGGTPADIDDFYQPIPPAQVTAAAIAVFSQVWGGNTALIPGFPKPPFCMHGGSDSNRVFPKEYCMCGENYATTYSLVSGLTPCPFNPTSLGNIVTFNSILLKDKEAVATATATSSA